MEHTIRAALIAHLRTGPAPLDTLNAIAEESPLAASIPWLGMAASASADWSTKDRAGHEIRIALELTTRGDDPAGDAALVDAIRARIETLPSPPDTDIASIRYLRGRTERRAKNIRATLLEYRVRGFFFSHG